MSHFNDQAAAWDSAEKISLMRTLAAKTREALDLSGRLDIMDFGCGTGLYGLELADYAKTLVGIDTSEGMLEVFNTKTADAPHISSQLIDLEQDTLDRKFDLIISSMAFHHLNDPKAMTTKLKAMLYPGGRLAIVDLDKEDGTFHPDNRGMGVKHFGFAKSEIEGWADAAGMSCEHSIINQVAKNDRQYGQFLAVMK